MRLWKECAAVAKETVVLPNIGNKKIKKANTRMTSGLTDSNIGSSHLAVRRGRQTGETTTVWP